MRTMRTIAAGAAVLLAGCEEFGIVSRDADDGGVTGPAAFAPPSTQDVAISDLGPGRDMGFRIDSAITFGQRQTYQLVITLPASYTFNGFTALGPAGTRIGAYGFEFDAGSPGPDRLFPIYSTDIDSAWVDANLDGTPNALKPQIEYTQDGSQNHVLTITLPRGGDGSTSVNEARFSSDVMAFLRTGIFTNPASAGSYPVALNFTSVDPDSGDANDNAGTAPETFAINGNAAVGATTLAAAILPSSRSVSFGTQATAFATIANSGATAAENCAISLMNVIKGGFSYQTTDPITNALTGTINTPANIPAGGSQSFVIAFTPVQEFYTNPVPFTAEPLEFLFRCSTGQAQQISGVNQLLMASGTAATADMIAIAATTTNDGILFTRGVQASGAIGVAAVNIGASGSLTVTPAGTSTSANTLSVSICETTGNASGTCLSPATPNITSTFNANDVRTFSVFVRGNGTAVTNSPARNRIEIAFRDGDGVMRGSTSVAVTTQSPPT